MAIVLYRVDERLIHGQVVIGWGSQLRPDRYVVVDDDLAESDWEQDLFRLGAGKAEVLFVTVETALQQLEEWKGDAPRTVLLTRDIPTMLAIARDDALRGEAINLGGIHHGPDRDEVLTYLHLSAQDRADLNALAEAGALVTARDLPDAHKVPLPALLSG